MNLEAYCPEIEVIRHNAGRFDDMISEQQCNDLVAAALRREIIKRGEWDQFSWHAFQKWWNDGVDDATQWEYPTPTVKDTRKDFTDWLTTPETLIRVAGEWVGRKEDTK